MSLLTSQVIGRANAPLPSACVPGIDLWLDPEFHETDAFRGLMRTHIAAPLVCEPVRSTKLLELTGEAELIPADT